MITIDASALIKVIITENDSATARRIFSKITENGEPLISPNIILSEVMNGLWKHYALMKDLNLQNLELARGNLARIYENMDISSQSDLAEDAFNIAIKYKTTVYDSMYAALSLKMRAPLFTFDKKLKQRAKVMKVELLDPNYY